MATNPLFAEGLSKVEELAARIRPALMCSEHEPLNCHRCLLVGRRLAERGNDLAHILRDGTIEPNTATEERLLARTRQTDADLFAPRAERLARARLLQPVPAHPEGREGCTRSAPTMTPQSISRRRRKCLA